MSESRELSALRIAGYVEGTTLVTLLGVAVPLKYMADLPIVVSVVGPVHGITFVVYIMLTLMVVSGGGWTLREALQTASVAFVPFGTFFNDRLLARKASELEQ